MTMIQVKLHRDDRRTYTYRCPFPGVEVGSSVVVPVRGHEQVAEIVALESGYSGPVRDVIRLYEPETPYNPFLDL